MDDRYKLTMGEIHKYGGSMLMSYYNSSPFKALQTIYPEHSWTMWRFSMVPKNCWDNAGNHRSFFDWLGVQLGYVDMDGWYGAKWDDVCKHGGGGLLAYYNHSLFKALQGVYPEHTWIPWRF